MHYRQHVNYYYDYSDGQTLSNDPEGNLVQLCAACAQRHKDDILLAQTGDVESVCELCDATQEEVL